MGRRAVKKVKPKKSKHMKFTDVKLVDAYGERPLNPAEYPNLLEDDRIMGAVVLGVQHKRGGWKRKKVMKTNPKKKQLQKFFDFKEGL